MMAAARVNECARSLTGGCAYLVCQGLTDVLHHSAHHPVLIVDLLGVAMQHLHTPPGVFKKLQQAIKVSFFFLFCLTQYVSHAIDLANAYSVVHLFEQPFIPTLRRIALFVSFACMASTTLM